MDEDFETVVDGWGKTVRVKILKPIKKPEKKIHPKIQDKMKHILIGSCPICSKRYLFDISPIPENVERNDEIVRFPCSKHRIKP